MPDSVEMLIAEVVDGQRPSEQPPFEALQARWRRRRAIRQGSAVAAVAVIAAAVALPAMLLDRSAGRDPLPPSASDVPSPAQSRPAGLIPWDVTGVNACNGGDCRTVTDPAQLGLLVDDVNVSEFYQHSTNCGASANVITLTFTGPRQPYPVIDLHASCGWWTVRGQAQPYDGTGLMRESAMQAQRLGVVVHDCGVTSPYSAPDFFAPEFVGLTLDQAQWRAVQEGLIVRVLGQDGRCAGAVTDDMNGGRVNLYLEDGRVLSAVRY